jgi:hypothetical protein
VVSKNQRRLQEEARRREKAEAKHQRAQGPSRFNYVCENAAELALVGPIFLASWGVPEALAQQLLKEGKPVPPSVSGAILIDTGATITAISMEAADELGLLPLRLSESYGLGGKHKHPVFRVAFAIGITDGRSGNVLQGEIDAAGIPDLEVVGEGLGLHVRNQRRRLIGLLGRDILQHAKLTYDGPQGKFAVEFDLQSILLQTPIT